MAVDRLIHRPPVQTDNRAQHAEAATPAAGTPHFIDSFSDENPMGRAESKLAPAPGTLPAPPGHVVRDLLQALDDMPFDFAAVLGMIYKNAQEIRKANAQVRDSELKAQFNELMKSADAMKTAANFRLAASLVQGFVQGVMAVGQFAASVAAAKDALKGMQAQAEAKTLTADAKALNNSADQLEMQAKAEVKAPAVSVQTIDESLADTPAPKAANQETVQSFDDFVADGLKAADTPKATDAPKTPEELQNEAVTLRREATERKTTAEEKLKEVEQFNAHAERTRIAADARNKVLDGVLGQPVTAGLRFAAESSDVQSKRHEATANRHQAYSNRASDAYQQAQDSAHDVIKKMEAIEQARHDTNRSIVRNQS